MSSKMAGTTHDRLQQQIGPIHDEIGRINAQIDKLRGERAILQSMAITDLGKAGLSAESIGHLAAACW